MDRRELEIMLNDAFDRGIVTARAVEGIYPPPPSRWESSTTAGARSTSGMKVAG